MSNRSTALRNSRTLPVQGALERAVMAPEVTSGTGRPDCAHNTSRNAYKNGMSEALGKRRNMDGPSQTVVQVLTEFTRRNGGFESLLVAATTRTST